MWVVWFLLRPLSLASDHNPSLCPHMVGVFSSCSEQGLLSSCGAWTSHCGGFSHCRAQALWCVGLVVAVPEPQSTGSVVVVHGLRRFVHVGASWTSVLCLLHWQVNSLPLSHQGSPHLYIFVYISIALGD